MTDIDSRREDVRTLGDLNAQLRGAKLSAQAEAKAARDKLGEAIMAFQQIAQQKPDVWRDQAAQGARDRAADPMRTRLTDVVMRDRMVYGRSRGAARGTRGLAGLQARQIRDTGQAFPVESRACQTTFKE